MSEGDAFMDQSVCSLERGQNEALDAVLILIAIQSGTK
jgi:hypothetical protein